MKKNLIFICILGVVLPILINFYKPGAGQGDFLAYWSASHLLITGGNPYNNSSLYVMEKSVSPETTSQPDLLMSTWNPPWLLLILAPLGLIPFQLATLVWMFCNTVIIGLTLIISWQICTGNQVSRGILVVFIAGFVFGITISYIAIGQITALVVLGMVLFVWWQDHHADRLAGAILLLTTIKPHISFFFLLIVFIWVIRTRRWQIIVGLIFATLSSLAIFWIIDNSWINDYVILLHSLLFTQVYTSTIGSFMASVFHIKFFNFSAIILLVFIKPILRTIEKHGWFTTMNIALLVSLPLSPFGFLFDQIVIIPSIVQIIAWLYKKQVPTKASYTIIGCLILFYLFTLSLLSINGLEYYWFFIIPIILLPIYLITLKMSHTPQKLSYGP